METYIPLTAEGFSHARKLGYMDEYDPPAGLLCLQCGCIVGSRWLHDDAHPLLDEQGNP